MTLRVGAVQSIYCSDIAVADFPVGTHTLSFNVAFGWPSPFRPTEFVVAKSAVIPPLDLLPAKTTTILTSTV
jgi:hypothetical protein